MLIIVDEKTDTISLCGLSWDQLFFLDAMLIKTIFETNNRDIRKNANQLLQACEAAEVSICENTEERY